MSRVVCQFSCGAASAVATKLTLARFPKAIIYNAFLQEEHPDNRRFLSDCERWFDKQINVVRDEKYHASVIEVFRKGRYIKGPSGAACSKRLKRDILDAVLLPHDTVVLGYTKEEQNRFDKFIDAHAGRKVLAPLIEYQLGKADCLAMIERAGIELPAMYRLGYHNANCVGCVKGGAGYWNKIRRDFPEVFETMAQTEDLIGPTAYLFFDRNTGERHSLRDLPLNKGRYNEEPSIECGAMCELIETEFQDDGFPK